MKYCIGCKHLRYSDPEPGCIGSTMTGIYGEEAARMACQRGHWSHSFSSTYGEGLDAFERAMEKAETCGEFEERTY